MRLLSKKVSLVRVRLLRVDDDVLDAADDQRPVAVALQLQWQHAAQQAQEGDRVLFGLPFKTLTGKVLSVLSVCHRAKSENFSRPTRTTYGCSTRNAPRCWSTTAATPALMQNGWRARRCSAVAAFPMTRSTP